MRVGEEDRWTGGPSIDKVALLSEAAEQRGIIVVTLDRRQVKYSELLARINRFRVSDVLVLPDRRLIQKIRQIIQD